MEERTSEIFKRLQKKQMEVEREAEEAEHKQEQLWREQGNPPHTHLCR
jgi:SH2 domain-containing protein 4A